MEFEKFPSLTRFSQGWTITEKLDGTNAQIVFDDEGKMWVGSRNRWLHESKDNMGFYSWCKNHEEELRQLGPGRHYGEWWGSGIQRGYGLSEKRFSLFNVLRWKNNSDLPECCSVVPSFMVDEYCDNPHAAAESIMTHLKENGSDASPGFMNPEGIVLFHRKSGTTFKKTFDYDEKGKWAEQLANKGIT